MSGPNIAHDPTLPVNPDQLPEAQGRGPKRGPWIVALAVFVLLVVGLSLWVRSSVHAAGERIIHPDAPEQVAVADNSEVAYCTPAFKTVLQRVLNSCGLVGSESRRGCQPADVKTFASISDDDFNALFTPLKVRRGDAWRKSLASDVAGLRIALESDSPADTELPPTIGDSKAPMEVIGEPS
jgi:hypothetical protein